jgi:hypothetical protein
VYCADFGTDGGLAIFGSGHLSPGSPLWAGVWVFDLSDRAWKGRNVPSEALVETVANYDEYGLSEITETLGHPYPPHTYDGLVYQSSANGGGTSGSLIQLCSPGSSFGSDLRVLSFDLSSTTSAPSRVINSLASVSTSYPASANDEARGGFWAISNNGAGSLAFVSYSDWSVTTYDTTFGVYGDSSLIYVPGRDCLVAICRLSSDVADVGVRVCPIVSDVPQGWTTVTTSGTPPTDARAGGVWSTILECIVSYAGVVSYAEDLSTGYVVNKLTVPASLTGDVWAWSSETLTAVGGAEPTVTLDGNSDILNNGSWSRFVEVPSARCFLYAGSINGPTQAWRLTGM